MNGLRPKALVWVPALVLLVLGLVFFGQPGVKASLAGSYRFDPRRLDLRQAAPAWLAPPMARSFFRDYLEISGRPFALVDDRAFDSWLEALRRLPWVAGVRARRRLPRRVDLDLELRRPEVCVPSRIGGFRLLSAEGRELPLDASDCRAVMAPPPEPSAVGAAWKGSSPFDLPWILGGGPWPPESKAEARPWREASALASLCRRKFWPRVGRILRALRENEAGKPAPNLEPPVLVAIDVTQLAGLGGIREDSADHALLVRTPDAVLVRLLWGHGRESPYERIPWEEKALTLAHILQRFPGLQGLSQADLRFPNRWLDRCVPIPPR